MVLMPFVGVYVFLKECSMSQEKLKILNHIVELLADTEMA
jgi:hypothetical protein